MYGNSFLSVLVFFYFVCISLLSFLFIDVVSSILHLVLTARYALFLSLEQCAHRVSVSKTISFLHVFLLMYNVCFQLDLSSSVFHVTDDGYKNFSIQYVHALKVQCWILYRFSLK